MCQFMYSGGMAPYSNTVKVSRHEEEGRRQCQGKVGWAACLPRVFELGSCTHIHLYTHHATPCTESIKRHLHVKRVRTSGAIVTGLTQNI
jgi:hypothetical protein